MDGNKKVKKRNDGVKYIIIPKESEINSGDWVMVSKISDKEVNEWQKKNLKK